MLYVGARYATGIYGVVDTDDGTMTSCDGASLVKYVTEMGLEIKGVERKGEHTARISVVTDPAITGLRK